MELMDSARVEQDVWGRRTGLEAASGPAGPGLGWWGWWGWLGVSGLTGRAGWGWPGGWD